MPSHIGSYRAVDALKDMTILIPVVAQLEDGVRYLKLNKEQVEQLPETAVHVGGSNK